MTKDERVQILDTLTKIELEAKKANVMAGDLNGDLVDNSWNGITADHALGLVNADAKFNILMTALHSVLETCRTAQENLQKADVVEKMQEPSQWTGMPAWTAGKNVEVR